MIFPPSMGFDLETMGDLPEYALQPFRAETGKAGIKAASIAIGERTAGMLYPEVEKVRRMLLKAVRDDLYVVGWNTAFDAAWCIAVGLETEVFQVKWLDAMLLWRHAVVEPEGEDVPRPKRKSYSLASAMHEFYPDQAGFKDFEDFQATDEQSLDLLLYRNEQDALWTLRLAEKFWGMLNDQQIRAALIEARCIPMIAKTRVMGIVSSADAAQDLADKLATEAISIYRQLLKDAPEVQGINLGSPKQLQALLYETWGLMPARFSRKTKLPSTDKYALFDLAAIDPRASMLKKLREAKNNRTKYAKGTINSLAYNGDGRVRPQAKIFSTYTSRITYGSSDKATEEVEKTTKKLGTVKSIRKCEVPVGVALHQWKRGKEYRRLIMAPPGYMLCEFDFAGQEFRWMAVASGDETMLSLCAPGEDAHGFMGARVASCDYRELVAMVKAGDADAAFKRKAGKFCIAEGQLVLTDKGLVPIEQVSLDHRVWDGVEWVNHEGLIFQGFKEVITYEGLTATPDHYVFVEDGRIKFGEAAQTSRRLVDSGVDRHPIRVFESSRSEDQENRQEERDSNQMPLRLRNILMGIPTKSYFWEIDPMQRVCIKAATQEQRPCNNQQCGGVESAEEMQRNEAAMREPERSVVQELWRERYQIPIPECGGSNSLRFERTSAPDISQVGHRQKEQRWPLLSWKSPPCYPDGESQQQAYQSISRLQRHEDPSQVCVPCIAYLVPRGEVCRDGSSEPCLSGAGHEPDSSEVVCSKLQTKRVYDLANAGPRHRFTVSGKLVANCNLSYQYRVSARTATTKARVEYELDVDEIFIKQTQSIYRQAYVGVGGHPGQRNGGYWGRQIEKCKRMGFAETFAGRRVQLVGNWAGKEAWPLESTAINYPIQGTGGDQKYLALAVARNLLPQFSGYLYYELHDGLFFIFPQDKALQASEVFLDKLSNLPYKQAWGCDLPIKFPVDAKIGGSWGDLVDLEKFTK